MSGLCEREQIVVVEAAGGYGKSVLAAELIERWQTICLEARLDHDGCGAPLLAARLHEAVARAGFSDAAAAAEGKGDPVQLVDAIVAALSGEACAFLIDDAHHASREAGELIDHLAGSVEPGQRLLVLARQLPAGAGRLRRAEYLQLSANDLALNEEETLELCRSGFGLDVAAGAAKALGRATGGWTAATALAAARAARTGEPVETVAGTATGPAHPAGALAAILDEALVALGPGCRPLLAQVARLPLLDADLTGAALEDAAFFERAFTAGVPFTPARGSWWDLPGPVRDYLAHLAPPDPEAMRRAARAYRRRDELGPALELLLATGDPGEAAALLAEIPPGAEDALDTLELGAYFDQLPPVTVDEHPGVLVLLARRFGHAGRYTLCCELLERARDLARRTGDPLLERAAAAELVKVELLADVRYEDAEHAAREILAAAGPEEKLTRARASEFLGYALCHRVDESGLRPEASLVEAEDSFGRASRLYRELGMRSAAAFIAVDWSSLVEFPLGQAAAALERVEEALLLVADLPRAFAFVMLWRATFAAELGRDELCRESVAEVLRIAGLKKSSFLVAQADRRLAVLASYRGDGEATLDHLRTVEQNGKLWWNLGSGEFLAEAADLADRVGHTAPALDYLARASEDPKDAVHLVALAEAVVEARHGDPATAEKRLRALSRYRLDPRERWRVTLLRGFAAFRRGEDGLAGTLAAQAFEDAALLGQAGLPLIRERAITEQMLALAVETGRPAAAALQASALPRALALLGRFELTVAGRPLPLKPGLEAQLLKLVAAHGGRVPSEQAIELLWPGVSPTAGRARLRTVLNRLRGSAGDVVSREGDVLVLDPAMRVDLHEFLAEARRAEKLAAGDPALASAVARGAIALYRGELLPDDRYEEWAEDRRSEAQSAMLALLDLSAAEAARQGDLDALRRAVERTIEFAPYDDVRYVRTVSALLGQGRRGEAVAVIRRARSAFARIGLDPPDSLVELERSTVA